MSDLIPGEGETEGTGTENDKETTEDGAKAGGSDIGSFRRHFPPGDLPEELLRRRLALQDTRKILAELCKSVPGLDEVLLPRGIQADALTRRSGSSASLIRGISRRINQDPAAWGAFRTALQEQISEETYSALDALSSEESLEEAIRASKYPLEELIFASLSVERELPAGIVEALISVWCEENQRAEKKAVADARAREMSAQLEGLEKENAQLIISSRTANERAAELGREVEILRSAHEDTEERVRQANARAEAAVSLRGQMSERIAELERRAAHLERSLEGERSAYSTAAERLEQMHEELGHVRAERDRIKSALQSARFTDEGFGELLVRSIKNEVNALANGLEEASRTAQLLEFMGKVLRAHADLRNGPRTREPDSSHRRQGGTDDNKSSFDEGDGDPSPAHPSEAPPGSGAGEALAFAAQARQRPTLSFKALGGAGEIGGSSHLLDFGRARVLIDAGIKPDGRGPLAPDFQSLKRSPDAVVITHAHLDHCGALPLLCRDHPNTPIYCTPPSSKLIISALNDHAAMGGGLPGGIPLHEVRRRLRPVPFGRPFDVGGARITLTESGHILGAASVLVESGPTTTFHTGDISLDEHISIPSARLPDVRDIDLLIMEATLADRSAQPFSESIRTMVRVINETTIGGGGTVLIPTYALGQAQETILGLKHLGREYGLDRDVFIYVDGSVVTTSERLYAEQIGYMKPYLQHSDPKEVFFGENIRAVTNDDRTRERILSNPCAIIASPVTMQGGASAFYRRRLEGSAMNAVILPSNAASYGAPHYKTNGSDEVNWRIEQVSFAAHCTQDELIEITERLTPRQIILVHGSKRRISDLAYRLMSDYKIHTPTVGETVRTVL